MTSREDELHLGILYRGPLESCNYGCEYCPFAKRREGRAELAKDRGALDRFVKWATAFESRLSVFFTPWGEALTRRWYRDAIVELSNLPHVARVAIQTNLSARLSFLDAADASKVALWCTYHPEWTSRERFLSQCAALDARSVGYSVGVVGMRRFLPEIETLRAALPPTVYVWVNAVKSHHGGERYSEADRALLQSIDPLFSFNAVAHPSRGRACLTGETVVTMDGDGIVRRCHFVDDVLGNAYERDIRDMLRPRACPKATCGCHIGYVHMPELGLREVFGSGLFERRPANPSTPRRGLPIVPEKSAR